DEDPLLATEHLGGLAPKVRIEVRITGNAQSEQLAKLLRLGLEALVGRGPQLQRSQRLDPGVRLAEHPKTEDGNSHEHHRYPREGDEQLGPDLDRNAAH